VRVRFGGNSPPLSTNWSVLFSSSEYFFCSRVPVFESFFCCCGAQATVCAWHCGPARVLPAARAAAATPRRATSRCRAAFLVSPKAEKPRILPKIDFFFVDFENRFSAGVLATHLSAAPGSSSSSSSSSSCSLKTTTVGARTLWA